jgi:flagellar biosynthesis protein FlhB
MMVVTLKLVTHTKFWPVLLILSIVLFSLGFYIGYMWISNSVVILTDNMLGTPIVAWSSAITYFFVLFCCCFILFLDGVLITIDFHYGKYASKMRKAVV